MEFFDNHKKLFTAAFLFFLSLSLFVVIFPAFDIQKNTAPLPGATTLNADVEQGRRLFIANGCVACHTQQVRNIDMDKKWGSRPSVAADYARVRRTDLFRNTATLMGTERTGPDLTNIGSRQPVESWHLVHLFNPRIVVKESIMPAYPWLFEIKDSAAKGEITVSVPAEFMEGAQGKVVATKEALQLVAYLQSLKQTELPSGRPVPTFLYPAKTANTASPGSAKPSLDGAALYATNCQSCHQPNGEGLKGAFPPLKGSKVVLDDNPELMVDIILNGYTGRVSEGYGPMPAVGTNNNLTAEEITAIMNHEKSSWGNDAKKVDLAAIDKLINSIKSKK
ncbi:MAG: cytochrome c [Bacteroidetes bacterium]|nr:cytochrome c [Bacteroidota bacterium]